MFDKNLKQFEGFIVLKYLKVNQNKSDHCIQTCDLMKIQKSLLTGRCTR